MMGFATFLYRLIEYFDAIHAYFPLLPSLPKFCWLHSFSWIDSPTFMVCVCLSV